MRKLLAGSNLALVVLLAYMLIRPIVTSTDNNLAPAVAAEGDGSALRNEAPTGSDYTQIIAGDIFETEGPLAADRDKGDTMTEVPPSELAAGLELIGTIAGDPKIALAVIKDKNTQSIERYKTGATLGDVRIERIDRNAVTLVKGLLYTRLKLQLADGGNRAVSVTAPLSVVPTEKIVPAAEPQEAVAAVERIIDAGAFEPHRIDGEVVGLRLSQIESMSFEGLAGLKGGDIVSSINGQQLTSKEKAFQIFQKARSCPNIDIEIIRDGKSQTLSFSRQEKDEINISQTTNPYETR